MKNLKVSMKLILSFVIAVLLTVVVGVIGIIGITTMDGVSSDMYENMALPLSELATGIEYFQRIRVQTRNLIIYSGDLQEISSIEQDFEDRREGFVNNMRSYRESINSEEAIRYYDGIVSQFNDVMIPATMVLFDNAKLGVDTVDLFEQIQETITPSADVISGNLDELTRIRMQVMLEANEDGSSTGTLMLTIIIVGVVIAAIASISLALYISNMFTKILVPLSGFFTKAGEKGDLEIVPDVQQAINSYINNKDELGALTAGAVKFINRTTEVSGALNTLATGDLTVEVAALSDRDVMGNAMVQMLDSLNNMFREVRNSTEQVSTGAKQIADGSQTLAQGSTEQASSVQQLSSSMTEIAEKTKENAEMAGRAAQLSETIRGNAEKGSRQMDEMMTAVKDINDASQSISKVIKTIDDIAFQTNILALNAAVEAARAGQHGKGFAVVAEEVRSLAAKSSDAAKDTSDLIANSMQKAELGSHIADETAKSLTEIVSGINESSKLISDIAHSSEDQSVGIEQVNKGIDQVAQVVQQNSATAEQSAAAAQQMSGQSDMLQGLIEQFKLKGGSSNSFTKGLPSAGAPAAKPVAELSENNDGSFGKY